MNTPLVFLWVYAAMIALSVVEACVEGRNLWDKGKIGWKIALPGGFKLTAYHFFLFFVMLPLFIFLPLAVQGWDRKLFGVLLSAYFSGLVVEDFFYFVVNPVVRFRELFSQMTDYYPWIRIGGKKIIPWGYVLGIALAILSWQLFWRSI